MVSIVMSFQEFINDYDIDDYSDMEYGRRMYEDYVNGGFHSLPYYDEFMQHEDEYLSDADTVIEGDQDE